MKLSTNLIKDKEKSLLESPTRRVSNYEVSSKRRIEGNYNSENCKQFVKVIFYLLVALMILFIGWTGWQYLTPKLSSSICRTDKPLYDSEFRRILYGLDRRIENEDSNGIPAEDVPWPSMPGDTVTTSTKFVEYDQRNLLETSTTSGIETDELIAGQSIQLWLEAMKDLEDIINNEDKDEASDTDSPHQATSIPLMTFSDFIRRSNRHSDYIRNSNMKDSSEQLLSHSRSDHQATSTISQSHNNRLSVDGTDQPAPKIKRSTASRFDEIDPEREKCKGSLNPAYEMMDELAIGFLTSDDYNPRIVQFRQRFTEYLTRFFWSVILPRPDQRRRIVKKSDYQVQSLLSALSNLATDFGREYNFVKRSPPTQEMTQQFRVIIETVIFGFEKCMWQQELARRATPGGRFRDYE